ncbi:glycosyltransferase [Sphingomonas panaciterrae]|uniref:glycosyltransferase n=1 Tax=Sphingomonas panaciterrae TaxID=1462999 RepID=UPI002FF2649D
MEPKDQTPEVSVIIPVWNSEKSIVKTLEMLSTQTVSQERFEVIVVDNGSTDATAKVVGKFPFAKLLSEPVASSYRARNRGLAAAKGDFVLFTDGDCVPAADWVEQAMAAVRRVPDAGIYAGEIALFRELGARPVAACYEELTAFNQSHNAQVGHCVTANWLCRRADLLAIGGFDSELLSGGDRECSRRMVASGHRVVHIPEMIVRHPTRATLGELMRKRRRVVGGRWIINNMAKAGTLKGLWQMAKEAAGQSRWMARANVDPKLRAGVIGATAILMLVSQAEILRLSVGRPPYRS